MNNAFINPKFMNTRDLKDDTTAYKVRKALMNKYPSVNIQVVRLGSINKNYIPSRLLITSSQKLDEKYPNCRRIMVKGLRGRDLMKNKPKRI